MVTIPVRDYGEPEMGQIVWVRRDNSEGPLVVVGELQGYEVNAKNGVREIHLDPVSIFHEPEVTAVVSIKAVDSHVEPIAARRKMRAV